MGINQPLLLEGELFTIGFAAKIKVKNQIQLVAWSPLSLSRVRPGSPYSPFKNLGKIMSYESRNLRLDMLQIQE